MASTPAEPQRDTILEDIPFHLARAALAFRRFNERTLQAVGLKPQAPGVASVLHAIDEKGACTVSHLVGRTHLPNGTLTGLLDSLEGYGFLERADNPEDGRSWKIRLTKKGSQLCGKLRQRHRLVMEIFHRELSARDAQELARLLTRVTDCMRNYPPAAGTTGAATMRRGSRARAKKSILPNEKSP